MFKIKKILLILTILLSMTLIMTSCSENVPDDGRCGINEIQQGGCD